jgi:uncharacterized protein YqjF (DUF2071 family)
VDVGTGDISEYPPAAVKHPVQFQGWQNLTFLHWAYEPDTLRRLLPPNLQLDTFEGRGWVSLTPFVLTGLRPPLLPPVPWLSRFPEMNVRTYVRGPDGKPGIWFFSLEADRLAAVVGGRLGYRLPYRWAQMRVRKLGEVVEYSSRRHLTAGRAEIAVRVGTPINASARERFLTARFRLYTTFAGRLAFADVEHPPWPLKSVTLLHLEQDAIEHSGPPRPAGEPLAHFSPGVHVRVGRPRLIG